MSEINVVTASFGSLRKAMTMPIVYQYDVVQMLKIRGLDLPTYFMAEFCNYGDTTTVNVTGSAVEGVQIPDSLIQTGRNIKVYIVLTEQDSVQTRYEITIPVYRREPRNDIDPSDDQQLQIDALVAALNDAINRAEAVEDLLMGGDEDQILRKNSDDDLDFEWSDETKEFFLVTYGTTTYSEIYSAMTYPGKVPVMHYYGMLFIGDDRYQQGDDHYILFYSCGNKAIYTITVKDDDTWSNISSAYIPSAYTFNPKMDGTASAGTSDSYAKGDHVHPHDTSKADVADLPTKVSDLTNDSGFITASDVPVEVFWATYGTTTYAAINTALNAGKLVLCHYYMLYIWNGLESSAGETYFRFTCASSSGSGTVINRSLKVTTGNVWSEESNAAPAAATASPLMDGTAAVGSSAKYAKEDHVHPSDTSKITMPAGGSVGQVLKKTASGTEWANESGGGGGGTTDYDDLSNKPQIAGTTLSGNKSLADLGIAAASDIPTVPAAATDAPVMDGTAAVGTSTKYAKADHVHPSDTSRMTSSEVNAAINRSLNLLSPEDIGAEPAWSAEANIQDGAVTKSLSERVSCIFTGDLTSLTITLGGDANGHYHFDFSTGSTAPTLTLPSSVLTPDGFQVEANKAYEVDILNKHAAIQSWSLS